MFDKPTIENVEDYVDRLDEQGSVNPVEAIDELEDIDDGEDSTAQDKARAAVSYFISQGFTVEAACGIVGNLIQESGLDPLEDNGSHKGLAQWDYADRWRKVENWMDENAYNDDSFAGQIRAIYECEGPDGEHTRGTSQDWNELKAMTNMDDATYKFAQFFEGYTGEMDLRKRYANNAYAIYQGDDSRGIKD